jgi:probable phosphoglycerate mutase
MPGDVAARADAVIAAAAEAAGDAVLFAHGHVLRVLAARWIGQPPEHGAHLLLDTAAISVLAAEHGVPALRRWNDVGHLPEDRRRPA